MKMLKYESYVILILFKYKRAAVFICLEYWNMHQISALVYMIPRESRPDRASEVHRVGWCSVLH